MKIILIVVGIVVFLVAAFVIGAYLDKEDDRNDPYDFMA